MYYPVQKVNIKAGEKRVAQLAESLRPRRYAEIGCNRGSTARLVAKALPPDSSMYLFDFEDNRRHVADLLRRPNTHFLGSDPRKAHDSYCWHLLKMCGDRDVTFDLAFIDGSHTFEKDALAFYLLDELMEPGGHVLLHDYGWTLDKSSTLNEGANPAASALWTREQMEKSHVSMIVDNLVSRRYEEVEHQFAFRKPRAGST